jgi:hypothetical protein
MNKGFLIAILLTLAASAAHAGAVSKCRGADGKLVFTDKGCRDPRDSSTPDVGDANDDGAAASKDRVGSSAPDSPRSSSPSQQRDPNFAKRARDVSLDGDKPQ